MIYSSAYIFGRQITAGEPPTPPWSDWWWNSPNVCPVREVNNFIPYCYTDTFVPNNPFYYVTGNNVYNGHDIGCTAKDITATAPWGYDYREHSNRPYRSACFVPLVDSQGNPSTTRLVSETAFYVLKPYVDQNDKGSYDIEVELYLYTEDGQYIPLHPNGVRNPTGAWKASDSHLYILTGVDCWYKYGGGYESDIIYGGIIADGIDYNGDDCISWGLAGYKLQKIYDNGYRIDPTWYNPS